eukprot:1152617-Pelagomonas_calceolata.AAC.1
MPSMAPGHMDKVDKKHDAPLAQTSQASQNYKLNSERIRVSSPASKSEAGAAMKALLCHTCKLFLLAMECMKPDR